MKLVLYLMVAVALFHKNNGSRITLEEKYGFTGPLTFLDGDECGVNCTGTSGSICSDDFTKCDSLFFCIPGMNPVEGKCPLGQTCNEGKCSEIPSALCEYGYRKFKCNTEGMYPEPSSCKKYNYCIPPGNGYPIPGECESGWAYNPATTLCDRFLERNICTDYERVVPTCLALGQNAALNMNPVLYYVCLPYSVTDPTLYPNIYKCPRDTMYQGDLVCA